MPSGITHVLLTKELLNKIPNSKLKYILADSSAFLTIGAVAPDLPYASIADDDFFFTTESPLADKFHYEKTNQIPLQSLIRLKSIKDTLSEQVQYQMFSFFLGYISHVIADGIFHPFVRDKVGDYDKNKSAHRSLEMQLDVLLYEELTKHIGYASELNYTDIQEELLNYTSNQESDQTIRLFSQLIKDVYGENYPTEKINDWIEGLHRLFNVAAGEHIQIYRHLEANTFLFKNREDIDPVKALILKKPKDRDTNFLKTETIDFMQMCVPEFFEKFVPLAKKSYDFVFEEGSQLTEVDIPAIDLDTGRLISSDNLDLVPEFWI
jgi:hypothetical protein